MLNACVKQQTVKTLIENAEYEAAKNEQAFVEGRIKELEILLATAKIIEDKGAHDSIQVGSTITIQEVDTNEKDTFTIVGAAEAKAKRRSYFQ